MARYALVIGVSEYSSPYFEKLPKAATDAEEVAKVLETYGDFQVKRLPNKWNKEAEKWEVAKAKPVTKDEVITELKQLLWERGTKSEVLIYFAGHGIRFINDADELKGCLAVSDCKVQSKEGKVVIPTNGIALDTINRLITNEKCQISRLVMLLDCCHSGSLLENQEVRETLTVFGSKTDYYLIAGCRSFEKERAFRGKADSIFTGALLKSLSADNANSDGTVTTELVFNVINNELKDSEQEPIFMGGGHSITLVKHSPVPVKTVSVPQNADKAKIEGDFRQGYEFANKTLQEQYEARLEDKNKEINRLFYSLNQAQEKLGEFPKLMAEQPKFQQTFNAPVNAVAQNVEGNQNVYASEQKQTLTEAAAEIQKLLKQLEQTSPDANEAEKIAYVSGKTTPSFKRRVVGALKAGGETAIEEFLDNPYVNVGKAVVKGWIRAE